MRTLLTIALAATIGVLVGGVAVQGLHAQGKAPVYMITEVDVSDPSKFAYAYTWDAYRTLKKYGGTSLAVGGVGVAGKPIMTFAGEPSSQRLVTITVWPSMDDAKKWRDSEEYATVLREGEKYATFRRVYAFEGRPSPWP